MTVETNNNIEDQNTDVNETPANDGPDYKAKYDEQKKETAKLKKESRENAKRVQAITATLESKGFDPESDDFAEFLDNYGKPAIKKQDVVEDDNNINEPSESQNEQIAALQKQLRAQQRAQSKMEKELNKERETRQRAEKRANKQQIDRDLRAVFCDDNGDKMYDCDVDLHVEAMGYRAFVEDGITMLRSKTDPDDYEPLADLKDDITSSLKVLSHQNSGAGAGGQTRTQQQAPKSHLERLQEHRKKQENVTNSNRLY